MMEIERKFLVDKPPLEQATRVTLLRQGYLAISDKKSVRIRQEGELSYTLTAKALVPGLGLVARWEAEIEISAVQFDQLWPLTVGCRIAKQRHYIPLTPLLTATVDCFDHCLQMVEVEFQTIEDADAFQPPEWFGREVTHDGQYTNASISRYGNPMNLQAPA